MSLMFVNGGLDSRGRTEPIHLMKLNENGASEATNGIHEFICFCLLFVVGVMAAASGNAPQQKREQDKKQMNEWMKLKN